MVNLVPRVLRASHAEGPRDEVNFWSERFTSSDVPSKPSIVLVSKIILRSASLISSRCFIYPHQLSVDTIHCFTRYADEGLTVSKMATKISNCR